ncbi:hypothetical protein SAMN05216559_1760 [Halomicrobium zhouii]|uniref:Uncharacterized protein n=1 Tax=Halomicrobium zhouii TaxID=767519 RepID=A0A1I6L0M8_9EURY|nr:hypothetical protein [Halomicrobium zhouii]SFR97017.1 hypothetical protein SAMN05216559_1760 [Halomicrobium zhouii]
MQFAKRGGTWEIVDSTSDPSRVDSDGDGLTDREEVNGWEIHIIDDHEDAKEFVEAVGDDSADHTDFVKTPTVTSDPTQRHSDNDGLSDAMEQELGTDPDEPNTDGDNLGDGQEQSVNADPTMFDVNPPKLNVISKNIYQPSAVDGDAENLGNDYVGKTFYGVRFSTQDYFGLSSARLTHNGKVTWERTPEDREGHSYAASYTTNQIQTGIDSLTGAATRVVLEDAHGNTRSKVVYERQTAYVHMAEQAGWEKDSVRMAIALGMVTGFGAGAGQMAGAVKAMTDDFEAYAKSVAQIVVVLKQRGVGGTLEAMADGMERQMKLANPYDFNDQRALYEHFRTNYYLGMIAFEATLTLAGTAAVSAGKNSARVAQLADKASDTRIAAAAPFAYNGYRTATAPTRWMKGAIAGGLSKGAGLTIRGANRVIDSSTIGKALKKEVLYRQLDVDTSDLSKVEQDALNNYLDETGRDGVWLANE